MWNIQGNVGVIFDQSFGGLLKKKVWVATPFEISKIKGKNFGRNEHFLNITYTLGFIWIHMIDIKNSKWELY